MSIYRGPGGAGDATTDSSTEAAAAINAAAQAATSATNAESSATQAANSATAASSSASAAASSATLASNKASDASIYASNASISALAASTSATSAASSATSATNSANSASTDASAAASYASSASSSATLATSKATDASNAASVATTKATQASTSATNAATSETNAAASASSASTSASTATTQASNAATSATAAATSASTATTKASEASTSATNAATSATNAANSATAAATSATNSANSATSSAGSASSAAAAQIAAETARDQTLAAYDNFDDRYLGTKAVDPTLDNDGNALVAGALYFNSSDGAMKVYTGTTWVAAYASLSGALLAANNLSDVQSASSARTNLGLGTAAITASTDYATAAQGTKADTAYGWGNHASAGYAADSLVAHLAGTETITGAKTFSSTITGSITGNAGTVTNGVYTTGSYSDPTWLTSIAGSKVSGNISGNAATATTATNQSGGTVAATTLSASSTVTLSGGTANGVAYLNGSKVLTTGSALTFDGTNLGLGTNTPSAYSGWSALTLNGATGGIIDIKSTGTLVGQILANSTGMNISTMSAIPLLFLINGSEQMRLTSTGLGIGTSSPSQKLHVSSSSGTDIRCQTTDTTNAAATLSLVSANTYYLQSLPSASGSALRIFDGTAGAERLRLDSSGNLGLGVTPSAHTQGKSIEVGHIGNGIWSAGTSNVLFTSNSYFDGAERYATSGYAAASYQQYNGQHIWYRAPSGTAGNPISFTQAMTLDASGNLLVGTTAALNYSSRLRVLAPSNGSAAEFYTPGSNYTSKLNLTNDSNGAAVGSVAGNLVFYANDATTERMRIDSSGNLLVGTTSPLTGNPVLSVKQAASAYLGTFQHTVNADYTLFRLQHAYAQSTQQATMLQFCDSAGNERGTIKTNGTTTSYNTSSDYRLKENIQPMQGALAVVQQLNPVTYTWKADGSDGQGFIAHELQAVVPDCVTGEKDAVDEEGNPVYQGIDTSFLVATLTKAIQELKAELDATKAEVAALKGT